VASPLRQGQTSIYRWGARPADPRPAGDCSNDRCHRFSSRNKRALQGGGFFEPTVLADVTTDMVISKEETFGPVAPLYRFTSEADAVKMANDAPASPRPRGPRGREGVASYFYSRDTDWRVVEALEYGIVSDRVRPLRGR
jgi:acyl-CoA reductase-like NAD-dependent aldehyde dehydrogenase